MIGPIRRLVRQGNYHFSLSIFSAVDSGMLTGEASIDDLKVVVRGRSPANLYLPTFKLDVLDGTP